MPSGGARKGAGRKPKPLAEKLAAGNPGHRPLKKVEFTGTGGVDPHEPPAYLRVMEKREQENRPGIPTPTELYTDTVKYLEPSGCLHLVPAALIADYAMAKYYLLHAQYELGKTATVVKIKKGLKKEPAESYEITDFAEAMLKMQKNVKAKKLRFHAGLWHIGKYGNTVVKTLITRRSLVQIQPPQPNPVRQSYDCRTFCRTKPSGCVRRQPFMFRIRRLRYRLTVPPFRLHLFRPVQIAIADTGL